MGGQQEQSIGDLGFWPIEAVDRLRAAAITDVGQLLALADTTIGRRSLAAQTGLAADEIETLVNQTRAQTGRTDEAPVDTSNYGLGALPPRDRPDE